MQRAPARRTLAAILFTDVVGSTAIVEELGDRRFKDLMNRHNQVVRRELKRHGGAEHDTAGDGFFASFGDPTSAIASACAISEAVRELGIEIRAGIHFGECEDIGKKPGGITVVVAARIMALGGSGDVFVSGTAAELARGAGFGFEDRGTHALKGVEDEWRVVDVTSIEGTQRPPPLGGAEARDRRARVEPEDPRRRRLAPVIAAAVLVVGVGAAVAISRGVHAQALVPVADSIARIDPSSNTFAQVISVGQHANPDAIVAGAGKLWTANVGNRTVSEVDPSNGSIRVFGAPSTPTGVAFEDGRAWITYGFSSDPTRRVDVLDPANPVLTTAQIAVPDGSYPIAGGAGALWIADPLGSTLTRYDPFSRSTKPVALAPDSGPSAIQVSPGSGTQSLWVTSGRAPSVTRVDAAHPGRTAQSFDTGDGVPSALVVAPDGSVWLVSREGDSVIALSSTGTTRVQEALGRRCDGPDGVAATASAVWVSCSGSRAVVRLDPSNGSILTTLPTGGTPGPMTIDAKGAVWVAVQGS